MLRIAGIGLIGYALQPLVARKLQRAGVARRRLNAYGSVDIDRPIGQVFSFFKDFESFPRIAGGLRSVVDYEDGRSRWEAYAPSGGVVAWDVVVTKYVPNSVIAWASVPRSDIDMHGLVRFTPLGPSRTRIDVDVSYQPAHTRLNDAVLSILERRKGPKLGDVLERLRFYIESLPTVIPGNV